MALSNDEAFIRIEALERAGEVMMKEVLYLKERVESVRGES